MSALASLTSLLICGERVPPRLTFLLRSAGVWDQPVWTRGHWVSSQTAAARSWFKPPSNQDSTFISRCHYSPAALWQMALWDIGFYGRSSFISNFFSHLMRSSRSSQIQFAVWILIGLCTPPIFHLLVLYHSLSLTLPTSTARLRGINGLLHLPLNLGCRLCNGQHTSMKKNE